VADHAQPHDATPATVAAHGANVADAGHGGDHDDGHGHGGDALGPIDWPAWGAAVLGIASALLIVGVMLAVTRPG
jgi:hypothetical protein